MIFSHKSLHRLRQHDYRGILFFILTGMGSIFAHDAQAAPAAPDSAQASITISGLPASKVEVGFAQAVMNKNLSGEPVSISSQPCMGAIFVHAPSRLTFTTKKQFAYFKARLGIDGSVGSKGRVRFLVFLDGKPIFSSAAVSGGEQAIPLLLAIGEGNTIELVVDSLGEGSHDHSVWCEPEFLNQMPGGWQLTSGQGALPRIDENVPWETGDNTFASERGLFLWNVIAATSYLLLIVLAFAKRRSIYAFWKNRVSLRSPQNAILILTAAICLFVFSHFWDDGLPASWDAGQHYFRAWQMKHLFLANFRIDGWSPYWYLGVQQYLFYSPLFFVLIVLLHFFTFQLVPLVVCFKLFYFLVYLCLPFSCYWLMRQFRIDPIPAALAALGVPAFSALHGMGVESLFVPGLVTQGFGLIVFCFALGLLKRIKDEEHGIKSALLLGLTVAVLFIGHIITSVYFICCAVLFAVFHLRQKRFLKMLMLAISSGAAMAAFALWPTFSLRELRGPDVGWGDFDGLRLMLEGNYFGSTFLNAIAILGLFAVIFSKDRDFKILSVLAFVTYVLASGYATLPDSASINLVLRQVFKSRTFPYLGIYLVMLCGVFYQLAIHSLLAAAAGSKRLRRLSARTDRAPAVWVIFALVLVILLGSAGKLVSLKHKVKLDSDFASMKRDAFLDGFHWLKNNTPRNVIVTFDDRGIDVGDLGFNQFASQINIHSNRYTLQGNQVELTRAHNAAVVGNLASWPPQRLYEALTRYNVSYVYTWNDDVVKNLSRSPDRFRVVYHNGFVSIWQVVGYDFRYLSNDGIEIRNFYFSPETIRWEVQNAKRNNALTAAVAYHPDWKLYVNGSEATIAKTPDNLITFWLPQEKSLYHLELRFQKSPMAILFCYLSLAALLAVLYFLARSKGKPEAPPDMD